MRKENVTNANILDLPGRLTRSRATALLGSQQIPPRVTAQPNKKRASQTNPMRACSENDNGKADNAGVQRKRRAILQDVTNVVCDSSYRNCFNASKVQAKSIKPAKKGQAKITRLTSSNKVDSKEGINSRADEVKQSVNFVESFLHCEKTEFELGSQNSELTSQLLSSPNKVVGAKKGKSYWAEDISESPHVVDVDVHEDPQLCGIYASEIFENLRVAELIRRPFPYSMSTIQGDITPSMRGILVDWLVEVSEEYKLVPDTLYLTVYLIDRFLSENHIERQHLQLVGITCMLIASKYEEISAPPAEEFCIITDSTYTKEEVLKMEVQVLKYFKFQLFAPTAKTFLRRFIRVAQASYTSPCLELEYLANFLAELTLVDSSFLTFLPSVVAASAVFLSRWTLDQISHPWNPTLEYHTTYKSTDLKTAVIALQDLQLNTNNCPLSAIRLKYRQLKFLSVAALSSQELPETLF